MENKTVNVNISTNTIIKLVIFFLIIGFLFLIKEIVVIIFLSFVLASALDPFVDWLQKRKIPRGLGIVIIYILLFAFVSLAVILIIPPISKEVTQISENFPLYYEKIVNGFNAFKSNLESPENTEQVQQGLNSLGENLSATVSNVAGAIFSIFGGLFSVLLVLVLTFYFTINEEATRGFIYTFAPSNIHPYINSLHTRIQKKLGSWLRGQLILSLVIFALTFIGLTILGVPYALVLAFIAGILEIIPTIGPLIAAIPAAFFAFLQSPVMGVSVIILYIIIQELENHLIVPKIMSKSVGLNPLIVIISVLIGAKIGGVFGALFAVPVVTAISVFLRDIIEKKVEAETKLVQ